MSHCYIVEVGGAGGEVTLHPVDKAFVEYWTQHFDWQLTEHVDSRFESDQQSPSVSADDSEDWQTLPQLASVYGATEEGTLTVYEVTLNGGASIIDGVFTPDPALGFFPSFTRGDCVLEENLADAEVKEDKSQILNQDAKLEANDPVMSVCTLERGPFASAFFCSEQPLDPEKLEVGFIGTNFQRVVNGLWYAGAQLELESSDDVSELSGIHCEVGYIDLREPLLGRSQ